MGQGVARRCPVVCQGRLLSKLQQPSQTRPLPIAQVRIVDKRAPLPMVSKGLLITSSALPEEMLLLPFSMLKVPSDAKAYIGSLLIEDTEFSQYVRQPVYTVDTSARQAYWQLASSPTCATDPQGAAMHMPDQVRAAWVASGKSWEEDATMAHVDVVHSCFGKMAGNTDRLLLYLLEHGRVPRDIFKRWVLATGHRIAYESSSVLLLHKGPCSWKLH